MLSLSMSEALCRSTWTCIGCSAVSRSPQILIARSAARQSDPRHQRKHSSSKASSSSKDDLKPITPAPKETNPAEPPTVKRSGGRRSPRSISKPSAIKNLPEAYPNIPSVPSTAHLHPMNVHVASFFSHHRPISVTKSFPEPASESTFSAIFEPKKAQPFDVITTVSSAIETLESAAFQDHDEGSPFQHPKPSRHANTQPLKHLDGRNDTGVQTVSLDVNELSKSFRHFVPPPPPAPLTDAESSKSSSSSLPKRRSAPIKERTYSSTLTITEHTHPSGVKTYQASVSPVRRTSSRPPHHKPSTRVSRYAAPQQQHQTQLSADEVTMIDITDPSSSPSSSSFPSPPSPPRTLPHQPFLERMQKRQQMWEDGLTGKKREMWRAISVKRQRKLKMKKHKYKKLMRKTRNLRRRLDRN